MCRELNQTKPCAAAEGNWIESVRAIIQLIIHPLICENTLSLSAGNAERWEAIGSLQLSEVALPNAESPAEIATANTSKTGDRNKLTQ